MEIMTLEKETETINGEIKHFKSYLAEKMQGGGVTKQQEKRYLDTIKEYEDKIKSFDNSETKIFLIRELRFELCLFFTEIYPA